MYIIISLMVIAILIYSSKNFDFHRIPNFSKSIKRYLKIFVVFNLIFALLMIIDFMIPKEIFQGKIIKNEREISIQFHKYEDRLRPTENEVFDNGEIVEVGVSKIFQEVMYVKSTVTNNRIDFAMEDIMGYLYMIVFFIVPMLLLFEYDINNSRRKFSYFMLAIVTSVGFIISMLIGGKLILVHIFKVIERV